jgi:hypothetical protein
MVFQYNLNCVLFVGLVNHVFLLQMYAEGSDISQDNFCQLLLQAYKLSMDHYPDGPQTCKQLSNILRAVIDSAVSLFYMYMHV